MPHGSLSLHLGVVLALALLGAPGAGAQGGAADSTARGAEAAGPRSEVAVPLPSGRGVFYYRAGSPGNVRIRSRVGPRRPEVGAAPEADGGPVVLLSPADRGRAPVSQGITRLDLLLLERDLLDAIDRRLAALDLGRRSDGAVYLPPQQQAPVIVVPGQAATPSAPVLPPVGRLAPPTVPGDATVEEVERAILDTGLFRTTRVHFEFGEAGLIPVSEAVLRAVADVLRRYPDLRVEVGGHTDAVSSDAFNLRLSQRRADSVRDFLVGAGVEEDRLVATGYGERRPVASNETETGRALNRRVEFVVLNPEAAERAQRAGRDAPAETVPGLRQILREELERLRRDDG